MANLEIERKFLVKRPLWAPPDQGTRLRQGYLPTTGDFSVRVRVDSAGAAFTLKGPTQGAVRLEFEYQIPRDDGLEILEKMCAAGTVDKVRYVVLHAGHRWEVDEYLADNEGLITAEVEAQTLADLDRAVATRPPWVGDEVTEDPRFFNSALAKRPFGRWSDQERHALTDRRLPT